VEKHPEEDQQTQIAVGDMAAVMDMPSMKLWRERPTSASTPVSEDPTWEWLSSP
jgi:hypothetical protein